MSRDYPDWINPFKAAQARREFAGSVRLAELERVKGLTENPGDAEIAFRLAFDLDGQREVRVEVSVSGKVPMTCQRSLRLFEQVIDSASVVAIVESEEATERLPKDYEPLVVTDARVRTIDLVAEELLLALPLVPTAPDSTPVGDEVDVGPASEDRQQPFAGLADLVRKRD
jgi:uncharacterized protein